VPPWLLISFFFTYSISLLKLSISFLRLSIFYLFQVVHNCLLSIFIVAAFKSSSDNSNTSVTYMYSLFLQFEISPIHGMVSDFLLKSRKMHIMLWDFRSCLNLMFLQDCNRKSKRLSTLLVPGESRSLSSSLSLHLQLGV
jgi:hypothetical protein